VSRHTLAHATNPKWFFIVGYDKVPGAFFCQAWKDRGRPRIDDCFEIDHLEAMGAVVPEGLREILIKEACGDIPWSTIKDWRPVAPTARLAVPL